MQGVVERIQLISSLDIIMEPARNEAKTSAMCSVPLLFKYTNVKDRLNIFRGTCDCMVAPSLASSFTPDE